MDQDKLRKRMSQIELEIDEMNHVIDENLQLNEKVPEDVEERAIDSEGFVDRKNARGVLSVEKTGDLAPKPNGQETKGQAEITPAEDGIQAKTKASEKPKPLENNKPQVAETLGEPLLTSSKLDDLEPQDDIKPLDDLRTLDETISTVTGADHSLNSPSAITNELSSKSVEESDKDSSYSSKLAPLREKSSQSETTPNSEILTAKIQSVKKNSQVENSEDGNLSDTSDPAPQTLPKIRNVATPVMSSARQTSNPSPFRVVSVSGKHSDNSQAQKLQSRHDYLTCKCTKLQREIQYLSDLRDRGAVAPEDTRKINGALVQLQEYLDRKTKERYEIGVLLSRQLRREIDRGENGQFWVGN
ncbi:LANO_0H03400g1_1 [Lachancea nothofagi CBS 11611]|uniref:LANO_0H03400g1_1 n=1 Tax=Lachancea nothofagi CBS 11611 TaxID=1266666 RepID=A0A1G4KL94_9SACH|nr:LANO_0H03400g1_1 [Lachancea nothofagi CBS 11611]